MDSASIAIIIPAYKEQQNLRILLKDVQRYLPRALIVVVNDSPSDHEEYPGVILIARETKMGRGSAVLRGFTEALKHKEIKYFFEMDADLAHLPAECKRFLAVRPSADMVIGSRYLESSRIVKWPLYRLVQSKVINIFLRYLLGLHISDFTNGFRLYKRPVVKFLINTPMKERGFIALSEMAYKIHKHGFSITEVPVSFTDRKFGSSSANIHELFVSLIGAFRIRFSSL